MIQKAVCCITNGDRVLVFKHPTSGYQLPKGTVEENESPEDAATREAFEETGLRIAGSPTFLFSQTVFEETDLWIERTTKVLSRPDAESFDWITLRRGLCVKKVREAADDFVQIAYEEWDDEDDPRYVSYAFTGWVRREDASAGVEYRFFRLDCPVTAEKWSKLSDNHVLDMEWRGLGELPPLYGLQESWKPAILAALRRP